MVNFYHNRGEQSSWYPCSEKVFFFYLGRVEERDRATMKKKHTLLAHVNSLIGKGEESRSVYHGDKFSILLEIVKENP